MGEYSAVTSEYMLRKKLVVGEMYHLTRYLNFDRIVVICARSLLGSVLPQCQVLIM